MTRNADITELEEYAALHEEQLESLPIEEGNPTPLPPDSIWAESSRQYEGSAVSIYLEASTKLPKTLGTITFRLQFVPYQTTLDLSAAAAVFRSYNMSAYADPILTLEDLTDSLLEELQPYRLLLELEYEARSTATRFGYTMEFSSE